MKFVRRGKRRMTAVEFSKLTGIAKGDLCCLDDRGILCRAYRDKETGRRYYIPEQRFAALLVARCFLKNVPLDDMG